MTVTPPLEDDWVRRARDRAFYNGALSSAFVVVAGAVLAMTSMPPVATPGNVAKAYIEARFSRDWAGTWALVCTQSRTAVGGYARYAELADDWAAYYRPPPKVEISVDDIRGTLARGTPSALVTVSLTSDEPMLPDWEARGHLLLVQEEDGFRVCERGEVET